MNELQARDCWDRRAFRLGVGLICALVAASAIVALFASVFGGAASWALIGFEVITLIATVIGFLGAVRHARQGPAMMLLCVAGAVGVGSLLAFIGTNRTLMGFGLGPVLAARFAAAALLGAAAGCILLSRDPSRSLPSLIKGIVWTAILVAVIGVAWMMRSSILGAGGAARVAMTLVLGIASIGLVAASTHYLVNAFAFGAGPRFDEPEPEAQ